MKQAESTNRIFDPRGSLVVVAGAGTGKTYNLVRRYLTLIATTNPDTGKPWSKPSEVLAITFTRAAAAEMRSRVISLLRTAADATGPGNFSVGGEVDQVMLDVFASHPDYDRLIAEINAAPIDTIHGLCARLLREFPELSGVPVDARPVEPAEASVLVGRFLTGFLDRLLDISDLIAAGKEPAGSVDPDDAEAAGNLVELLKHFDLKSVRIELGAMLNQSDEIPSDWFSNPADCRIGFLSHQWCFVADKLSDAVASALKVCEDYLAANPRRDEISLRDLDADDVTDTEILSDFVAIKLNLLAGLLNTLRAVREGDFSDCCDFFARLDALADEKVTGVEGLVIDRSVHLADVPGLVDALARIENARKSCEVRGRDVVSQVAAHEYEGSFLNGFWIPDDPHLEILECWIRLGAVARDACGKWLQEQGLLRFNDLEDRALKLLLIPAARDVLRGRFNQILVDEYQDTNQKQANIVAAIAEVSDGARVFRVGDPKQSIYRFRGADVHVFNKAIKDNPAEVVELAMTRRTSPALAGFFNQFFPGLLDPVSVGGPDDAARVEWTSEIICSRPCDDFPGKPVDLMIRTAKSSWQIEPVGDGADQPVPVPESVGRGDEGVDEQPVYEAMTEPVALARHIRKLLDSVTMSGAPGTGRPLTPADFAVLLRSWTHADEFRQALEDQGIPAELAGGRGLLAMPEVRDLINLIRFLADANDNMAATGVLRGPCFGISDLGLYVLARWPGVNRWQSSDDGYVVGPWESSDGVKPPFMYPRNLNQVARCGALAPDVALQALRAAGVLDESRVSEIAERLNQDAALLCALDSDGRPVPGSGVMLMDSLVARSAFEPPSRILQDAIAGFRLESAWIASSRGRRAVANAWKFVDLVRGLEAGGAGLAAIVSWIDSSDDPTPEGLIAGESCAVTITTIHGAKGLEWPIVAVAGLGDRTGGGGKHTWQSDPVPNLDKTIPATPLPRIGIATEGLLREDDALKAACDTLLAGEEAAEEKRLLYVAMTRARDHLILSGTFAKESDVAVGAGTFDLSGCDSFQKFIRKLLGLKPDKGGVFRPPTDPWDKFMSIVESVPAATDSGYVKGAAPVVNAVDGAIISWGTDCVERPSVSPSTFKQKIGDAAFGDIGPMPLKVTVPEGVDERLTGTMFHALMEQWGFRFDLGSPGDCFDPGYLRAFAARFETRSGVDHAMWLRKALELFPGHPLYPELRAAADRGELFHEVQVSALLPSDATLPGGLDVAGRIDLLFRDAAGRWCVIDYKETRKVTTAEELQGLKRDYGPQLSLYRAVLESWKPGHVGRLGLWLALAGDVMWME